MANFDTLKQDIYSFLEGKNIVDLATHSADFSQSLAKRIVTKFEKPGQGGGEEPIRPGLRISNLGKPCERQLWYGVNIPEEAEKLPAQAIFKFLFGDILEETILWLAKATGHEVTDEQKEVDLYGVKGHIDGIVDGVLVDVKSSSTRGMEKFRSHLLDIDDPFGYRVQLDGYCHALGVSEGAFIAVDKTLGHIEIDKYPRRDVDYKRVIERKRELLASQTPPERQYQSQPVGKSGNRGLGVECSYCPFKHTCWPGARTFMYASGPVYLTDVVRLPDVREVT